jgi:predicted Rossmann fold flavoprotein
LKDKSTLDAIVIGAGAAGLMFAAEAGRRGCKVLLLEHQSVIGRKILISGGGRCNFTNLHCAPENFISSNAHFAKSALARYTPADFIALVEKHNIRYHEKKLGQLFCDGSAEEINRMLYEECRAGRVRLELNCQVRGVSKGANGFVVVANKGTFEAQTVVVASGGLSIPKIGATDVGYLIAKRFGLKIVPCRPALVPLTWTEEDRRLWSDLAGVATDVRAATPDQRFDERMLFTHRGLSGPAILQISSYWDGKSPLSIDLLPNTELPAAPRTEKSPSPRTLLSEHLPKRLADRWLAHRSMEDLHDWQVVPGGTEGYTKAEVTAGGVHPDELSSKTMESRRVPGLFFIGEVVDVTGHLGGFNFQWAWASAYVAAEAVQEILASSRLGTRT